MILLILTFVDMLRSKYERPETNNPARNPIVPRPPYGRRLRFRRFLPMGKVLGFLGQKTEGLELAAKAMPDIPENVDEGTVAERPCGLT
ncbi:hypothetical protein O1611_g10320 [Lasiodiplodia mahajangana]|uniref:Uncharacterized protein n=1 Tax=Lasiodiplodia mahajangana TaxID=1108764 RepID=A0ACC2IZW6_9PEZI|nr:hypothetical protein O1611_g10320 [Lasiodiplodia mahajangana]